MDRPAGLGPGGEHRPQLGPHAEVGAVEVDGQGAAPLVGAGVGELGVGAREPGHVGGEVEAAVLGDDAVDEGVDRGLVGDVEGGDAVAGREVGDDHRRAARPQQLDGRGADARRPAGDERDLAVHVPAHGVNTSGSLGEEHHDAVDVDEGGLVGLDLRGVRRRPEEGEEAGVVVEVLHGDAVEGVAVAVVGRRPVVLLVAADHAAERGLLGDHPAVGPPPLVELVDLEARVALDHHRHAEHLGALEPFEPVAGVDVQRLAGDGLGQVRRQEQDGAGDLASCGAGTRGRSRPPSRRSAPRR